MLRMHIPTPNPDENVPDKPDPTVPNPPVPPDMEPVVPQRDPPMPGRGNDVPGEPPQIIARHVMLARRGIAYTTSL